MKKKILLVFVLIAMLIAPFNLQSKEKIPVSADMGWWREAKFGMFIHYGLYSMCEGYWKGEPIDGIGEWIYHHAEIPVEEYKQLAKDFTGDKLDVEAWIKLAKQAGMKYAVITTKHHDGFALFNSEVDSFNVVDATPYGKDIIKEFVEACRKYDMKIGFYYSHYQDWSYPGAGGNTWEDGYQWSREGFKEYMDDKALPQVREILTNFGKIDMIWYDTPGKMTKAESDAFLSLAKELQPGIIVSGRIGNDLGDYVQMEDNDLPKYRPDYDWEAPVTMNHTWAYKKDDHHWKSLDYILWQLTYCASMGGNYLLNIGPKGDGSVPEESVERLSAVGDWMKENSEAITGTKPSPFRYAYDWGGATWLNNKIYLMVSEYPKDGKISLYGLKNKVRKAYYLVNNEKISFSIKDNLLVVDLKQGGLQSNVDVVVLEVRGEPIVNNKLIQGIDKTISLDTELAVNTTGCDYHFGSMKNWRKPVGDLTWEFDMIYPGKYRLEIITTGFKRMAWPEKPAQWDGGHEVSIEFDGKTINGIVDNDRIELPKRDLYNDYKIAEMGEVNVTQKGIYTLKLIPKKINSSNGAGLAIRMVRLVPINDEEQQLSEAMKRFEGNDSDNELYTRFRYRPLKGLGYQEGVNRRDPSSIIKVDSSYYVWYTRCTDPKYTWLNADIYYATSLDGIEWEEKGVAVKRGKEGAWDDYSVFTTNILVTQGKYYLVYQARSKNKQLNVVGMSWAANPNGPWEKLEDPILETTPDGKLKNPNADGSVKVLNEYALEKGSWDSGAIHDPEIIPMNGKYYLYYKGHGIGDKMHADSKIGVAISDSPEGPYIKSKYNPVLNSGHEVWMFPWKTGLAAIVDWAGPEKGTIQYSEDGINFKIASTLEDIPPAGGAYIADKFLDNNDGQGFSWGVCHYGRSKWTFLVGFECDLEREMPKELDWKHFKHYSTIRDVLLNPKLYGVDNEILLRKNR